MLSSISIASSFDNDFNTDGKPVLVVIVGRQPLLRQGVKQVVDEFEFNASVIQANSLDQLYLLDTKPDVLVLFKHVGECCFYNHLASWLDTEETLKTRVVVVSDTLGDADLDSIDRGLVDLFLPMKVDNNLISSLLSTVCSEREVDRQVLGRWTEVLYDHFMPDIRDLIPKELQVMACLQYGLGNRDIADNLNVSVATVKSRIRVIYKKLNVSGRVDLMLVANRQCSLVIS